MASPRYAEARDALARFAELVKSPEHVHTYRITPLSIWNACAAGEKAEEIVESLRSLSRYPVPEHIAFEIEDYAARFGSLTLHREETRGSSCGCRDRGPGGARGRRQARGAPARGAGLGHELRRGARSPADGSSSR